MIKAPKYLGHFLAGEEANAEIPNQPARHKNRDNCRGDGPLQYQLYAQKALRKDLVANNPWIQSVLKRWCGQYRPCL